MSARACAIACALVLAGCYLSHQRASDGGMDGGGPRDASMDRPDRFLPDTGLRDTGPPDAYTYDGPLDCSEVAGFRRCDEACPMPCPDRIRCPGVLPLCIGRSVVGEDSACAFFVANPDLGIADPPPGRSETSLTCPIHGFPCAVPGGPAESSRAGMCVPLAVCLDERPPGFPEYHCVWSDNTLVTGNPPLATCPPDAHPSSPFCGGACARTECPVLASTCIGLSNTRGFGICEGHAMPPITGVLTLHWRRMLLNLCSTETGATCAYFVPVPQPSDLPFGWPVVADACRAYRAIYPAGVECRDVDWNLLP